MAIKFQLMSDLHLETPQARPTYGEFQLPPKCQFLALLGDIGNVWDHQLFDFLREQLNQFQIVFYLLGNHEGYGTTMEVARKAVYDFEEEIEKLRSFPETTLGQFVFLYQKRFDLTEGMTVLGCTLFSRIATEQRNSVALFCSDFSEIADWTIDAHNSAYQSDLDWLNAQVTQLAKTEPHRKIVIFTHFSPTILEAASDPKHLQDANEIRSAFVTDLSSESCWTSKNVILWSFGHTHFNCDFEEVGTKKRVVANQKGYRRAEVGTFDAMKVVEVGAPMGADRESQ